MPERDGGNDVFAETATYEDALRPGSVAAAADQPHLVKVRQREKVAERSTPSHHDRKAPSPAKLTGDTWKYSLKRSLTEFGRDQCTDLAAALTYYTVLAIFPALIALVSILSLVGEADRVTGFFVDTVDDLSNGDEDVMGAVETVVGNISTAEGAGIGLAIGILAAMWTASNYVNAFSRSMNRIWEVTEGRPVYTLRPILYALTAVMILLVAVAGLTLVISGPIAESVGNTVGLGETAVAVWNWATPVLLVLVAAAAIGLLYWTTPNIRQPNFKFVSVGALIAIVVMAIATIGVVIYVMFFGNYDATYGSLAGVIILLFWLYIMNMVLLLGAEVDAELERGRQLQAGIEAERTIMLPARETKGSDKKERKYEAIVASGYALRISKGETSSVDDLWRR